MIWLSWRQMRTQIIVVIALLVALAIDLQISGAHILHIYNTAVVPCQAHDDCASAQQHLTSQAHWIHVLGALMLALPALLGVFWGAPLLARELETGTFRLVWSQSVSRWRWFVVKFAFVGLVSLGVAAITSVLITRWSSPVDLFNMQPFQNFDVRDIVPVAYTAFAFALGVTAGMLIRRTLPAMAATLVVYIGARFVIFEWVRSKLAPVVTFRGPYLGPGGGGPGSGSSSFPASAWTITDRVLNSAGHVVGENGGIGSNGNFGFSGSGHGVTTLQGMGRCPNTFPSLRPINGGSEGPTQVTPALNHAIATCVKSFHLQEVVTYQPAGHYWPLQWAESGVFLGLALLLGGFSMWFVRRRLL
jgi:hypothetical protein